MTKNPVAAIWFPNHDDPAQTEIVPITHVGQIIDARGRHGWFMHGDNIMLHDGVDDEVIEIVGVTHGVAYRTPVATTAGGYYNET